MSKVDFNPFREIVDGKDLAYLLFLRSYISTDESEPGILSKYEFSPDGKVFTGQIANNLFWSDGSEVTPYEAAMGIARGLLYRALGDRVKVKDLEGIEKEDWHKGKFKGIEIVDRYTFKIRFISQIENITGVVREALSTNSRHNRLWPVQIRKNMNLGSPEVLTKFPYRYDNGSPTLAYKKDVSIKILTMENCKKADFTIFPESLNSDIKYNVILSPVASAITMQPHTKNSIQFRGSLVAWVRHSFKAMNKDSGIIPVDSFFLAGESGYDGSMIWPSKADLNLLRTREISLAVEIPIFKTVLMAASKEAGISIKFVNLPSKDSDFDGQVLASGMQAGRHLILQDFLSWNHVSNLMKKAPRTENSLRKIAKLSASTVPPDTVTLKEFERNAFEEMSIAPIARKHPTAFTAHSSSVCLTWTMKGELTFSSGENCKYEVRR